MYILNDWVCQSKSSVLDYRNAKVICSRLGIEIDIFGIRNVGNRIGRFFGHRIAIYKPKDSQDRCNIYTIATGWRC